MKVLLIIALCIACIGAVPRQSDQPEENEAATKALKKYLSENFGGMSIDWYEAIRQVSVRGDTAIITTNLDSGYGLAQRVCSGVSGYVFSRDNMHVALQKVKILGKDKKVLIFRQKLADKCSPDN